MFGNENQNNEELEFGLIRRIVKRAGIFARAIKSIKLKVQTALRHFIYIVAKRANIRPTKAYYLSNVSHAKKNFSKHGQRNENMRCQHEVLSRLV